MRPDHSSDLVCLLYVKTRICNPPAVLSVISLHSAGRSSYPPARNAFVR